MFFMQRERTYRMIDIGDVIVIDKENLVAHRQPAIMVRRPVRNNFSNK